MLLYCVSFFDFLNGSTLSHDVSLFTFDALLLQTHTHCVCSCALNSFSFVWLGAADFTTSKSLRNPTLLRPSRTSLTICASEFFFLLPHHYYSLPINFGFIQIQWPNDDTSNFTLQSFRLCFTLLRAARALLRFFSPHRTALRYDLAVSCFLLTVLRHKICCCCGCLLTNHFTSRVFFSPPHGVSHVRSRFAHLPRPRPFSVTLSSVLTCFFFVAL